MTDLVPSSGRLDDLARNIKTEWEKGRAAYADALDSYLSMGHQLAKARSLMASDIDYGRWFKKQGFPFSPAWAKTLRDAAENEGEIRDEVASQLATGKNANLEKAVKAVRPKGGADGETGGDPEVAEASGVQTDSSTAPDATTPQVSARLAAPFPKVGKQAEESKFEVAPSAPAPGSATAEGVQPAAADGSAPSPDPSAPSGMEESGVAPHEGRTGNPVPGARSSIPGSPDAMTEAPGTGEGSGTGSSDPSPDHWEVTVRGTHPAAFASLHRFLNEGAQMGSGWRWQYDAPSAFSVTAEPAA